MIIKIGKKRLRFKTSFDQFTLRDMKKWWKGSDKIAELYEERKAIAGQYEEIEGLIEMRTAEETEDAMRLVNATVEVNKSNLTLAYIEMISVLSITKGCQKFMEETAGLAHDDIFNALSILQSKVGDFIEYFESCACVEKFKHVGKGWYPRSYKVQAMANNTLIRDALASLQVATALNFKNEIGAGRWDNICKFVALVARPKGETFEMAFSKKAFINSKNMKGMDPSDKLLYYQQVLDKSAEGREKHFENLLLPVAIGVIKEYEKKKQQ